MQLTVGRMTRLLLNATRDPSGSNHTIEGWLKYGSAPVSNKMISIKVNETSYSVQTDSQGHFVKVLGLQTVNNSTSTLYVISASFNGDTAVTATAQGETLDGQDYPACTTIQYNDYKPSANSTSLVIEPQASQVKQQTKTPEQMQQEAEQGGGLTIWHEFSWTYPWYRLHIKMHVNPTIEVGFNPLLPGGEVADWSGLEFFGSLSWEVFQETLIQAVGLIGQYLLARAVGTIQPWIGGAIMAGKIIAQGWLFLGDWDNAMKMLASGLVSIAMSIFALADFYFQFNVFMRFVDTLWGIFGHSVQGVLRWMLMRLTEIGLFGKALSRHWIDAVEATFDFVTGLIALMRYTDLAF